MPQRHGVDSDPQAACHRDDELVGNIGQDLALARLVENLLIEALRAAPGQGSPAGLLRGLADGRPVASIHAIHADPSRAWTVEQLAIVAALSRSEFFQRFSHA